MPDSTDDRRPEHLDEKRTTTTDEVGDEGGGFGNVEVETDRGPSVGREADETLLPADERRDVTVHGETGSGRRNP